MKRLIYLTILLTFLLIPTFNVKALPLDSVRIYYYNDSGQLLNNGTTISDNWGGSQAFFNNIGFTVGSFQDIPSSVYAFFPSGLGCDNTSCLLQGEIISNESTINTTSYTPLDDVEINVEANGHYTRCSVIGRYRQYDRFTHVTFQCSASNLNNGFNINYSNMAATAGRYTYFGVVPAAFTITSNLSTQDIIISNNSNTNNIINNQDSNTQDIINNQDSNTQDIINNQNSNTQEQIESQKVCSYIDKNDISNDNSFLDEHGAIVSNTSLGVTDYFSLSQTSTLEILSVTDTVSAWFCFYNVNKDLISCSSSRTLGTGFVNIPANSSFFRASIYKSQNKPTFNICNNGNQALNDSLNNLNDSITDTTSPDTDDYLQDFQDSLASDTPITNLLTLPLTLINAYNNGINANCSPVSLGTLYGTNLVLPCIDLEDLFGSTLWYTIDSLCSIFLIYSIAMLFVHAFDNFTSLKDDFDGMYVPKHAGKHVGSGVDG